MSTNPAGCSVVSTTLKPGAQSGAGDKVLGLCRKESWAKGHSLKGQDPGGNRLSGTGQTRKKYRNLSTKAVVKKAFGFGLGSHWRIFFKKVFPENSVSLTRSHVELGPYLQYFHGIKYYKPKPVL